MIKSAENCGFGDIYWRNPQRKTPVFVQGILIYNLLSLVFNIYIYTCVNEVSLKFAISEKLYF